MDRYMVRRTRRSVERSYGVDGVQVISPDGDSVTHPADRCEVLFDGAAASRMGPDRSRRAKAPSSTPTAWGLLPPQRRCESPSAANHPNSWRAARQP